VGEGTDSAEIVEWHVAVGDAVREDEPLCDIETDKAVVGIPCPTTATVLELRAQEGDTVAIGDVLAVFGEPDELAAVPRDEDGSEAAHWPAPVAGAGAPGTVEAAAAPGGGAHGTVEPAVAGDSNARRPLDPATAAAAAAAAAGRALASPPARRLAARTATDLRSVAGSGPHGAVLPRDLAAARAADREWQSRGDERRPLRGTRRTIARTLSAQWQTVPHVTDYREADATALLDLRRRLRTDADRRGESDLAAAISATPILVKMAAALLRRHPLLNAAIDMEREEITVYGAVNVGVATATDEGLLVPVIHDADRKTVAEIAVECATLAAAARERRLAARDLADATFTVNNYGALGIWLGTPIIPPRQSANLGIGRIEDRAVVRDGEIVVRPIAPLACAGDHRLLDGDVIARFVTDLVRAIEDPLVLFGELR
jgi:pyruvate dehydrogenase E2 component (dihydrolipoamide acetyltransferase)